ncbi:MAG: hypothetical protein ACLFVP_03950 [Candidatus Bathyarchaeia archaeon]
MRVSCSGALRRSAFIQLGSLVLILGFSTFVVHYYSRERNQPVEELMKIAEKILEYIDQLPRKDLKEKQQSCRTTKKTTMVIL